MQLLYLAKVCHHAGQAGKALRVLIRLSGKTLVTGNHIIRVMETSSPEGAYSALHPCINLL
jgi:hypothetical protein